MYVHLWSFAHHSSAFWTKYWIFDINTCLYIREEFGYRPSKQDKLNSPQISAVIAEQTRCICFYNLKVEINMYITKYWLNIFIREHSSRLLRSSLDLIVFKDPTKDANMVINTFLHFWRLKREMKQEKELAAFPLTSPTQTKPPTDQTKSLEAIRKRLAEITRKMATNRTYKKRPIDFQVNNPLWAAKNVYT